MITYFLALYEEAKPLIEYYGLRKNLSEDKYQLFENAQISLVITGSGMINAAMAASRHFSLHAPNRDDIVINLGICGLHFAGASDADVQAGAVFSPLAIKDSTTGFMYYTENLFKNSISIKSVPLITSPVAVSSCDHADALSGNMICIFDMEAASLYQVFRKYFLTSRIFFFKTASDFICAAPDASSITPWASVNTLMSSLFEQIRPFIHNVNDYFSSFPQQGYDTAVKESVALIKSILPMTSAMESEFDKYIYYLHLCNFPVSDYLEKYAQKLTSCTDFPLHGKKQSMPYFEKLLLELSDANAVSANTVSVNTDSANVSVSRKNGRYPHSSILPAAFSTVYIENNLKNTQVVKKILKTLSDKNPEIVYIRHYKDIFNRPHQDFLMQKNAPVLIIAQKEGELIYKGARYCQSFNNAHFYYTSCVMNCIYDCEYCYLQGMYPSGNIVVFVNTDDYFAKISEMLKKFPVYLCISYDTDLLALNHVLGLVDKWVAFAKANPLLTIEIRTKCAKINEIARIRQIYGSLKPDNVILAWTLSPENFAGQFEHKAASVRARIAAAKYAGELGFPIRLCFDPVLINGDWKNSYKLLFEEVFNKIPSEYIFDASIGVFRVSKDYLKTMRRVRPDSIPVNYPYTISNGMCHYGEKNDEIISCLSELLTNYIDKEKIFIWNGD